MLGIKFNVKHGADGIAHLYYNDGGASRELFPQDVAELLNRLEQSLMEARDYPPWNTRDARILSEVLR